MDGKVFDRIEKKYLITKSDKKELLKLIHKNMKKDSYHKSRVINLYFDTDNFDLTIQSIDQPIFKHKLRARSYGGYDRVFLEIKTKMREKDMNPGYKRRVMVTHSDYEEFVAGKTTMEELSKRSIETVNDIQIAKEVDYYVEHFGLKPKIMVLYNRESYKDQDGLRITFDENLKYRTEDLSFNKRKRDKIYFEDDRCIIMEIKAHGVMPLWLVHELSKLHIYPQQFSKVGKIYQKIKEQYV